MKKVGGKCYRLPAPFREAEEDTDSQTTKPCGMSTLSRVESPVVVFLGACRVKFPINFSVICFLIDHQAFRPGGNQRPILVSLHGGNLQREAWDFLGKSLQALLKIAT